MTLDEAIRFCDQQYEEQYKCAVANKQIQEWLHELKMLKNHPCRPIVEAKWIVGNNRAWATCGNCGFSFRDVYDLENFDSYCRHCGASMTDITSKPKAHKR